MGQAKRRGSFEERKKQAIEAGRIKKSYKGSHVLALGGYFVRRLGNYMLNGLSAKQKRSLGS